MTVPRFILFEFAGLHVQCTWHLISQERGEGESKISLEPEKGEESADALGFEWQFGASVDGVRNKDSGG